MSVHELERVHILKVIPWGSKPGRELGINEGKAIKEIYGGGWDVKVLNPDSVRIIPFDEITYRIEDSQVVTGLNINRHPLLKDRFSWVPN